MEDERFTAAWKDTQPLLCCYPVARDVLEGNLGARRTRPQPVSSPVRELFKEGILLMRRVFAIVLMFSTTTLAWAQCGELIMNAKKAWLSRQRDGNYMFTLFRPEKFKIIGTDFEDFYIRPGEPIGVRHWCPGGVKAFFGVEIPVGDQIKVWVSGGIVEGE